MLRSNSSKPLPGHLIAAVVAFGVWWGVAASRAAEVSTTNPSRPAKSPQLSKSAKSDKAAPRVAAGQSRPQAKKPAVAKPSVVKSTTKPSAKSAVVRTATGTTVAAKQVAAKTAATPVSVPGKNLSARVDDLIAAELGARKISLAPRTNDEDFLRRVTFDLIGTTPSPSEVTFFGLDPDPEKRRQTIERLLESPAFAANWAKYWSEVVFSRVTEQQRAQLAQGAFETWMAEQLATGQGWDKTATAVITATGDVMENGSTALIFAHEAQAEEVAAEVSRIFLGVQIQCANCHDHPTDRWKREQFHQLAAYFPRITLRPKMEGMPRSFEVVSFEQRPGPGGGGGGPFTQLRENPEQFFRMLDRNGDGIARKDEIERPGMQQLFDRLLERGDANKDGGLALSEVKALPPPEQQGRGALEHFMPDLENPGSQGRKVDPAFFVDGKSAGSDLSDVERRSALAKSITADQNPWFARAFVNRIWAELLGEGFYMPVDDLGPERTPQHPDVLEALAEGFTAEQYNVKWLFRTIANSETYQRAIGERGSPDQPAFASAYPTRLRSDQLFDALLKALGAAEPVDRAPQGMMGPFRRQNTVRGQFHQLFGFDPSTPQDELTGTVPQALFLMNSPMLTNAMRANGNTRLAKILTDFPKDEDAVTELYLMVFAREPSDREREVSRKYIAEVGNRGEAFEDLLWSLVNSGEFQTKR